MEKNEITTEEGKLNKFLKKIPVLLSSRVSIFIYLFLFCYLVIFAILAVTIPALGDLAPTQGAQLVLGNYTNVLSALGASIAAGSGVAVHGKIKALHEGSKRLEDTVDELHRKIDSLTKEK